MTYRGRVRFGDGFGSGEGALVKIKARFEELAATISEITPDSFGFDSPSLEVSMVPGKRIIGYVTSGRITAMQSEASIGYELELGFQFTLLPFIMALMVGVVGFLTQSIEVSIFVCILAIIVIAGNWFMIGARYSHLIKQAVKTRT